MNNMANTATLGNMWPPNGASARDPSQAKMINSPAPPSQDETQYADALMTEITV